MDIDSQRHVRAGKHPVGSVTNTRSEPGDLESQLLKHCREQRVLLEAVAASPSCDELRLQAREVEPDRNAQQDVEILERN